MIANHTPGPWSTTKAKPRKVTAGGVLICNAVLRNSATVRQNANGKGEEEGEANARLISAAPDYHAVALEIAALRDAGKAIPQRLWQKLYDAIEKALGQ